MIIFVREATIKSLSCDSFRVFSWPAKPRLRVLLFLATKRHKIHKKTDTQTSSCDSFVSFRVFSWPAKPRLRVLLFLATKRHKIHKKEQRQRLRRFSATECWIGSPNPAHQSLSCVSFVSFRGQLEAVHNFQCVVRLNNSQAVTNADMRTGP